MADNYLEKQMEDFRAGRLNSKAPKRKLKKPLKGETRIYQEVSSAEIIAEIENLRRLGATIIIQGPETPVIRRLKAVYGVTHVPTKD